LEHSNCIYQMVQSNQITLFPIKMTEEKDKIKLSPKQKEIVRHLQSGECLITDDMSAGYSIGKQYVKINLRTFFNLVKKGIIFQDYNNHYDYILTELGKTIKL